MTHTKKRTAPHQTSSKLDKNWRKVLEELDIAQSLENDGIAYLEIPRMRKLGVEKDARLMIKLDTLESRPPVFIEQNLSLFPVSNTTIAIVKGTAPYLHIDSSKLKELEEMARLVDEKDPIVDLQSLDLQDINSEGSLILVLQNARILSLIHHAQNGAVSMTGMGRRRLKETVAINLDTPNGLKTLICGDAQFEMDSLHESANMITMAEAKLLKYNQPYSKISSLHLRQIVFPTLWLRQRLSASNSAKRIEPAVVLARPNTKNRDSWTVFWLPVSLDISPTGLKAEIEWNRAISFSLHESQREHEAIPEHDLNLVPQHTRAPNLALPQYNMISHIDRLAIEIGRLGINSGALTQDQALAMRSGFWPQEGADFSGKPVQWTTAMRCIPKHMQGTKRQDSYLREALHWLGFISAWDSKTGEMTPTPMAMSYAHSDRTVQIQILWNAMRNSPLVMAAANNTAFEKLPPISLAADGLTATSTAKRRYQAAKKWVKWLAVEVRRNCDKPWCAMPKHWLNPAVSV